MDDEEVGAECCCLALNFSSVREYGREFVCPTYMTGVQVTVLRRGVHWRGV